ncbi:hypothetical protein [Vandammella animalimorsus]|uniref:hypothetical protein n=1 Tax=Vandammella animalimorsus TaxID=2029117 RepID=UPI00117EDF01|nr:hypothetical protein [Vandammella animalimorsus]
MKLFLHRRHVGAARRTSRARRQRRFESVQSLVDANGQKAVWDGLQSAKLANSTGYWPVLSASGPPDSADARGAKIF